MKRTLTMLSVVFAMCIGTACTSAPKETVELTEIVGKQIAQMQVSHEGFVSLYYASLRADVNNFMKERWIPTFLEEVLTGGTAQGDDLALDLSDLGEGPGAGGADALSEEARFRKDLDRAYRLSRLDWSSLVKTDNLDPDLVDAVANAIKVMVEAENANFGQVMLNFSEATQKQINARRASLIQPIDEQEAMVLAQLREGYADLQRGSATIKAYLASVVKLAEERDAVLDKLGALENQRDLMETAMKASDEAAKALSTVENDDDAINKFFSILLAIEPNQQQD